MSHILISDNGSEIRLLMTANITLYRIIQINREYTNSKRLTGFDRRSTAGATAEDS